MLASTVQFSTTNQSPSARPHQTPTRPLAGTSTVERCEIRRAPDRDNRPLPRREPARRGPLPQDPTAGLPPPHPRGPLPRPPAGGPYWGPVKPAAELVSVPPSSTTPTTRSSSQSRNRLVLGAALHPPALRPAGEMLLRKEVIQPHLPVRLPCYDFVPIADPAFDGSLPPGVGPPASGVTDFRDVTGGVYKARERIHRSVADLRLLATPTSWGRVADPNPN